MPSHLCRFLRVITTVGCLISLPAWTTPIRADGPRPGEITALRDQIRGKVVDELTKHWYPGAVDREHGGFHQDLARDWTPGPDRDRFSVYQARLTWTAAEFARFSPEHREEYLGYVRHGVRTLDEVLRDREQGGFHFIVGLNGQVDSKLGDEKHVYGTAFILYAASNAYQATQDPRALAVARDAFDWLETKAHDPVNSGYYESLTRAGAVIPAPTRDQPMSERTDRLGVYHGYKSMNSHIHLLEAVAEFYRVEPTPAVRTRLEELLMVVRDRIAAPPGALNLYLTPTWQATPAHDSFGHDIETAFLLVEAAEALGRPDDERTWTVARSLVDHALDFGWDNEHGGFYDSGPVFNGKAAETFKIFWTEAEGLNALLLMHRKYGAETDRYWSCFRQQWDFIIKHLIDPVYNGWYLGATREGNRPDDGFKAFPWKANYHTSRAMLRVTRMLDEMEHKAQPQPVKAP